MTTTALASAQLATQWNGPWNGDLTIAACILSPAFRIHFGVPGDSGDPDAISGWRQSPACIAAHRQQKPGNRFVVDGFVCGERSLATRWTVRTDQWAISGIDVLNRRRS